MSFVSIFPQSKRETMHALPKDAWVLEGLAVRLREAFLRKHLDRNEAKYR